MRIAFFLEMAALGDTLTRFKALYALRKLYPNAYILFITRGNFASIFAHTQLFDENIDIENFDFKTQGGGA